MSWDLEGGLEFIRQIAPGLLNAGWGIGLTGSVLLRGESNNDLDLIVYPQNDGQVDRDKLHQALSDAGLRQRHDVDVVHRAWRRRQSTDCKHVEVWETPLGNRFDLFVLT